MRGSLRASIGALASLLLVLPGLELLGATAADASSSLQLRVSTSASRTSARALQGAVLSGATYVFLTPTTHAAKVSYYVDDPHRLKRPRHTDTSAPFDLVGGTAKRATPWWTTGLKEGTHHLSAVVTTTGGQRIVLQSVFTVRNTPGAPTTPRTVPGNAKVTVIWHSAKGTTTGFNLYRSTSSPVSRAHPLNGSTLLAASRTSFVDTTAVNGTRYFYVVVAVSAHGLASKPSSMVSARPAAAAPTPPPAPAQVSATPGPGQITVSWHSAGGSTAGFNVYRSNTASVPLTNPRNGASPLAANATSFSESVDPGKYYYVVQAVSAGGVRSDPSDVAAASFGPAIQLSSPKPVLYGSRNGGAVSGTITVTNIGDADLTVTDEELSGSGSFLTLTQVDPFTLGAGEHQDLTFTFNPLGNAATADGPQRMTVQVTSDDPDNPVTSLGIGGLAIDNATSGEPSLQWILDAYGINADDGDPTPSSYALDATTIPPTGGILVKAFTRRDSSLPVQVTALAAFVNPATVGDPTKDPEWGWTPENTTPGAATDSYIARRDLLGTTYLIAPTTQFGLWARIEGSTFSSTDNTSSAPRFIAFPVDGSPGTFVIADDSTGRVSDDWNDLPLLIQNVNTIPSG